MFYKTNEVRTKKKLKKEIIMRHMFVNTLFTEMGKQMM